jgi:hypothetical protein
VRWIDGHEVDTPENPHVDTLLEELFEVLYPDGEQQPVDTQGVI